MKPLCFIHVGTHKTGTTSVQNMLTANERSLAAAGVHIPRAGRLDAQSGHHNIAWELNEDARFDASRGTLADALEEVAREGAPRVCLSSEDFEYLHSRERALLALDDGLAAIGYQPVIVAYLRPQAGYVESLYAELLKHGLAQSFDEFLACVIADGRICFNERWRFTFEYDRLIDDFAAVFGAAQIRTRPYETSGAFGVVGDFLDLIGIRPGEVDRRTLVRARSLNASRPVGEVLALLESNRRAGARSVEMRHADDLRRRRGRFDPVNLGDVRRILDRFNAGNRRVYETYGALIPCVSGRDLVADVAAEMGLNWAARHRRRLIAASAGTSVAGIRTAPLRPRQRIGFAGLTQRICAPEFAQATLFEAILFVTAAVAALCSTTYGQAIGSTTLVEFGLLSAIFAASAVLRTARYALESIGIITDVRFFADFCTRLGVIGYAVVASYAVVNAFLDVRVPRFDPDWLSYPGLAAAALATLIVTIVLPAKRRSLDASPYGGVSESVGSERFYLACGYVTLLGLICHALTPAWWLDTSIDVVFVALVTMKLYRTREDGLLRALRRRA